MPPPPELALPEPALRKDAETIAVVGYVHGVSHFYHLVLPSLYPWLMRDFGLSYTQVGVAMTLFFVISGIGQALAGFAVDRFGARRVLLAGMGFLGLSTAVLSVAPAYPVLLLAGLLAGVGNSVFHPADFSLLNRKLPTARLGHAFSVHGVSGAIGWAAAPILVTALAAAEGWRVAAFSASLVALSGIALVLWRNDSTREVAPVRQQPHADAKPDGALAFLAVPEVWMCFAFFLAASTAFGALQSYLPTALDHGFGMPVTVAALAMSAFLLGTAFGTAAGGFVAGGRFGQDRVIAAALVFAAVLAVLLAGGAMPQWAIAPMLGAIGFATGMAGPSRDLLVRRAAAARFAQAAYGRIYGFVYSGLDVGMACAPLLFGPLMDAGHFHWLLSGVALLQVLAVFTALGIGSRSHPA